MNKNSSFKYLWLMGLLFVMVVGLSTNVFASGGRDASTYFFDDTWGDFKEEIANAREQGKVGILLFFEMDECPFCHRMRQTILNQPQVQAYFKQHFLNFAVDIQGDIEVHDFSGQPQTQKEFSVKKHRVRATPVFAIYDLEGKPITRYTGATSSIEEFLWLGEYVVSGAYKDMRFTKYKRQQKKMAQPSS